MYLRLVKIPFLLLVTALLVGGCSKNESSPTEPAAQTPTLPLVTFKGPNTTSTDIHAQMAQSYIQAMNAYTTAFTPYAGLPATQTGNTWTWSYSVGTFTITFTGTLQPDGSYQWKMVMNGLDPSDSTLYNNWTATTGTTSGDGKNGSWNIYDVNTTSLVAKYEWATSSNNVLTGTLTAYSNGTEVGKTVVVNNPDGSGELNEYTGTVLTYRSVWQANGSGQWWTYDLSGTQTGTGTWT
jgi:hypothetical protein